MTRSFPDNESAKVGKPKYLVKTQGYKVWCVVRITEVQLSSCHISRRVEKGKYLAAWCVGRPNATGPAQWQASSIHIALCRVGKQADPVVSRCLLQNVFLGSLRMTGTNPVIDFIIRRETSRRSTGSLPNTNEGRMRIRMIAVPRRCSPAVVTQTFHDQFDSSCGVRNEDQVKMLRIRFEECEYLKPRRLDDICGEH